MSTHMLIPLPAPFENAAGKIQNLVELGADDGFRGVAIIESKAGSRRSSHHHKTDEHYLYVLSGRMDYIERPCGTSEVHRESFGPGSLVHTGPMLDHWTEFPVDTVLISITKLPGSEEHRGDLVKVPWIEEPAA